jgi:hypothetical protein
MWLFPSVLQVITKHWCWTFLKWCLIAVVLSSLFKMFFYLGWVRNQLQSTLYFWPESSGKRMRKKVLVKINCVVNLGSFAPSGCWQCLETVFGCHKCGIRGKSDNYWHLMGGIQGGCRVSYSARDDSTTKNYSVHNVGSAQVEKPWDKLSWGYKRK